MSNNLVLDYNLAEDGRTNIIQLADNKQLEVIKLRGKLREKHFYKLSTIVIDLLSQLNINVEDLDKIDGNATKALSIIGEVLNNELVNTIKHDIISNCIYVVDDKKLQLSVDTNYDIFVEDNEELNLKIVITLFDINFTKLFKSFLQLGNTH